MKSIIVYDGVCKLCDWSVQFILRHDPESQFYFLPFQSEQGIVICEKFNVDSSQMDSFLLIENMEMFVKTEAWWRILEKLPGFYKIQGNILKIIPKILSNTVYDFIGKHRYQWFGQLTCKLLEVEDSDEIPSVTELRELFVLQQERGK